MAEIKVKDYDLLDRLIESVSNPENEWAMNSYQNCFCGHADKLEPVSRFRGIYEVFEEESINSNEENGLILPNDWYEANNERYSRENAVRVLTSIRDTGKFSW